MRFRSRFTGKEKAALAWSAACTAYSYEVRVTADH
jgi:hypothetical protein